MKIFNKKLLAFSLIELMVAVGILVTISTVVLANHTRFNSSVLLGSLAYDIALSIREAQVFGLSVKQFSDGEGTFQVGYGIRFSSPNSYEFFADSYPLGSPNKKYDEGQDSIVQTFSLGRGHTIQKFCGTNSLGIEKCSDSESPISHLDIVFFRPDPDAIMSSDELGVVYSSARIVVASPNGETRSVEVASTGQISVKTE